MSDAMRLGLNGIELLNQRFGPILQLDGWSSELTRGGMQRFQGPLARIYKRIFRRGSPSPFIELAFIIFGSMAMHHLRHRGPGAASMAASLFGGATASAPPPPPPQHKWGGAHTAAAPPFDLPPAAPRNSRASMAHPDDTQGDTTTVRLGVDAVHNLPRADGLESVCSGTTASHEDAATGDKKNRSRASRSVRSLDINIGN
jgi:hypothetical protein